VHSVSRASGSSLNTATASSGKMSSTALDIVDPDVLEQLQMRKIERMDRTALRAYFDASRNTYIFHLVIKLALVVN
jgi:hypothetical protein